MKWTWSLRITDGAKQVIIAHPASASHSARSCWKPALGEKLCQRDHRASVVQSRIIRKPSSYLRKSEFSTTCCT